MPISNLVFFNHDQLQERKKWDQIFCGLNHLVHKSPITLANQDFDRGSRIGSLTSIFEFMKPKCSSLSDSEKNKKRQLSPQPQPPEKLTLQEWILNSPSLNRIYPSFEERIEATAYKLQPRDRHKSPITLANQDFDRGSSIGSSTSIFEFMKPKCSLLSDTKNKKRQLLPQPQPREKLTLQEWILNSPSLKGIYPSFEERIEATAYKLQPIDRHKSPITLANQDFDRGSSIGSSTSISEFMKPKCSSLSDTKKNKKRQLLPQPQPREKPTLQEWILNSPSLNGIYPPFEERIEAVAYKLQPRDGFSLERMKMKVDDDEELEEDAYIMNSKSQCGKRKKVSFRLPELADIFVLDSEDGYYFSK